MAQRFLDQLPKIPNGLLPNGTECMICKEEYGTVPSDNGNTEHAVILPCLHHVGSECIAIWLSPDNGLGNSCPLCRTVFFPIRVRDYDDGDDDGDEGDGSGDSDSDSNSDGDNDHDNEDGNEDDGNEDDRNEDDGSGDSDEEKEEENDDGDEGDEGHEEGKENGGGSEDQRERNPMTLLDAFQRVASCSASTHAREETRREDGEWFERWPIPPAQQIETNEKRARLELQRPPPPPPSIFLQLSTSQTTHSPPPATLESETTRLASAYRTMAFRETLLYIKLTEAGSRMAPLRSPHHGKDLSAHQERGDRCCDGSWANGALSRMRGSDRGIWD